MKSLFIVSLLCIAMLTSCKTDKKPSFNPATKVALNGQLQLQSVAGKAKPNAPYSLETIARYAFDLGVQESNLGSAMRGLPKHDLVGTKVYVGDMGDVVRIDHNGNPQLGYFVTSNIRDVTLRAAPRGDIPNTWIDAYEFWDLERYKTDGMGLTIARDTIGYVPNRVIRAAEAKIKTAFEAGDYDECMRLFEQAYIFIPITGEEWRALQANNEQ